MINGSGNLLQVTSLGKDQVLVLPPGKMTLLNQFQSDLPNSGEFQVLVTHSVRETYPLWLCPAGIRKFAAITEADSHISRYKLERSSWIYSTHYPWKLRFHILERITWFAGTCGAIPRRSRKHSRSFHKLWCGSRAHIWLYVTPPFHGPSEIHDPSQSTKRGDLSSASSKTWTVMDSESTC